MKIIEYPSLAENLTEIGVRKVRVTATVTFEAYIFEDHEDRPNGAEARIVQEIADAVEYRAPHLTDSEPGDALVAAAGRVAVEIDSLDTLENDLTPAQVAERADSYAGEVF